MALVETTIGRLHYADTGAPQGSDRPVVVFVGGLAMAADVWDPVVDLLGATHRCVRITLPLGSHPEAMHPDAHLSVMSVGAAVGEAMTAFGTGRVTLVVNDSAVGLAAAVAVPHLVRRLVVTSCETPENFPPGLPGRSLLTAVRMPLGWPLVIGSVRVPLLRRTPTTYGWMSRTRLPGRLLAGWVRPMLQDKAVRRDLRRFLLTATAEEVESVIAALGQAVARHDIPTLVLWSGDDRVMPLETGQRLAQRLPGAEWQVVPGAGTLLARDRPDALADAIRALAPIPRASTA